MPSGGLPADRPAIIRKVEQFDGYAPLRNALRKIAHTRDQWQGIPMPLEGMRLTVEPRYPDAEVYQDMCGAPESPTPDHVTFRNQFYSHKMRCDIYIWNEGLSVGGENPPVRYGYVPRVHGMTFLMHTMDAARAWGIEQEGNAIQTLSRLLRHHQFKNYLLTGMFMESSKRSGLTYVFRKLRPTVVIDGRPNGIDYNFGDLAAKPVDEARIMCAMCMHPIGFYQSSWAGAMCPTDDIIAHLMMMRADEPMFWRRCNQHSPAMPEAGL